jgi:hypothetical protein
MRAYAVFLALLAVGTVVVLATGDPSAIEDRMVLVYALPVASLVGLVLGIRALQDERPGLAAALFLLAATVGLLSFVPITLVMTAGQAGG